MVVIESNEIWQLWNSGSVQLNECGYATRNILNSSRCYTSLSIQHQQDMQVQTLDWSHRMWSVALTILKGVVKSYPYKSKTPRSWRGQLDTTKESQYLATQISGQSSYHMGPYQTWKRQLWDRGFRRNLSLLAAWDTSIARTTGFIRSHEGCWSSLKVTKSDSCRTQGVYRYVAVDMYATLYTSCTCIYIRM